MIKKRYSANTRARGSEGGYRRFDAPPPNQALVDTVSRYVAAPQEERNLLSTFRVICSKKKSLSSNPWTQQGSPALKTFASPTEQVKIADPRPSRT